MSLRFPREWSSDDLFGSGPSINQPTKVDPGAAAALQGFVPGLPGVAAHHNYLLNQYSLGLRHLLTESALGSLTPIVDHDQPTAAGRVFATYVPAQKRTLYAIGTGGLLKKAYDAPLAQGAQSIGGTGTLAGLVSNGTATVAIFTGGNGARWKADAGIGGSWASSLQNVTNSGTLIPQHLIYDETNGLFLVGHSASSQSVWSSPDGQNWTNNSIPVATGQGGLAVIPGRVAIAGGNVGAIAFQTATIATGTWGASGGTIPNVASETNRGALAAVGSTFVYVGGFAGNTIRVHTSPDAASWALVATITLPGSLGGVMRLLSDSYSGMLYLVAPMTAGDPTCLIYASPDAGNTWLGPQSYDGVSAGVSCAGGRLYLLHEDNSLVTIARSSIQLPEAA